jgi:hypothetical protein
MDFVAGQCVDQVFHAGGRVGGIFAVGEAGDQFLERQKRIARGYGVALAQVLIDQIAQQAEVLVKIRQAL